LLAKKLQAESTEAAQEWRRVARVIAQKTGTRAGLGTATRMAVDADFTAARQKNGARRNVHSIDRSIGENYDASYRRGEMRALWALSVLLALAGQTRDAFAYICNANHYVNSSGHWVHSPSCRTEPDHQEAVCRDGSVSFSEHRRGTCSHHGGVEHWE
jgi:hypothetical protein